MEALPENRVGLIRPCTLFFFVKISFDIKQFFFYLSLTYNSMSKNLVIITAECIEEGKVKGGQGFTVEIDSDLLCYAQDECIKAFKTLLKRQSNSYCQFEYVGYEIVFHPHKKLNSEEFMAEFHKEVKKLEPLDNQY